MILSSSGRCMYEDGEYFGDVESLMTGFFFVVWVP